MEEILPQNDEVNNTKLYNINFYKFDDVPNGQTNSYIDWAEDRRTRNSSEVKTYYTFGDFDRFAIEEIKEFSRIRDLDKHSRLWLGLRQSIIVYSLPELDKNRKNNCFKIDKLLNEKTNLNCKFIMFSFVKIDAHAQKGFRTYEAFIGKFYEKITYIINKCIDEQKPEIDSYQILGTFSSDEIVIMWLSNQFSDAINIAHRLRYIDIQNNDNPQKTKKLVSSVTSVIALSGKDDVLPTKGDALINIIYKSEISKYEDRLKYLTNLTNELEKKVIRKEYDIKILSTVGEYDAVIKVPAHILTPDLFATNNSESLFSIKNDGYAKNILRTNIQLISKPFEENIGNIDYYIKIDKDIELLKSYELAKIILSNVEEVDGTKINNTKRLCQIAQKERIELIQDNIYKIHEEIRDELRYKDNKLTEREKFIPETVGLIDSIDLIFNDFLSNASSLRNDIWADDFDLQFKAYLQYIRNLIARSKRMGANPSDFYKSKFYEKVKDISNIFKQTIYHIAQSSRVIFEKPTCHLRNLGQYNMILKAFYGLTKNILEIGCQCAINPLHKIVPIITIDIVPNIGGELFGNTREYETYKLFSLNLPYSVVSYPVDNISYLIHEMFHYIPLYDKTKRNQLLGMIVITEFLTDIIFKNILNGLEEDQIDTKFKIPIIEEYKEVVKKYILSALITDNLYEINIHGEILDSYWEECKIELGEEERKKADKKEKEINFKKPEADWGIYKQLLVNIIKEIAESPITDKKGILNSIFRIITDKIAYIEKSFDNINKEIFLKFEKNFCNNVKRNFINTFIQADNSEESTEPSFLVFAQDIQKYVYCTVQYNEKFLDQILKEPSSQIERQIDEACADVAMIDILDMDIDDYIFCLFRYNSDKMLPFDYYPKEFLLRLGSIFDYIIVKKENEKSFKESYNGIGEKSFKDIPESIFKDKLKEYDRNIEEKKDNYPQLPKFYKSLKKAYKTYFKKYSTYRNFIWEILNSSSLKNRTNNCTENYLKTIREFFIKNKDKKPTDLLENNLKLLQHFQIQDNFKDIFQKYSAKFNINYRDDRDDFKIQSVLSFNACKEYRNNNNPVTTYPMENINDFYKIMNAINTKDQNDPCEYQKEPCFWFRGQTDKTYMLTPSIFREFLSKTKEDKTFSENNFIARLQRSSLEEFKFRAFNSNELYYGAERSEIDYLSQMQHYEIPTSMLDWSEDAMIAFAFAVGLGNKNKKIFKTEAALYVLNPIRYNETRRRMIEYFINPDTNDLIIRQFLKSAKPYGHILPDFTMSYSSNNYNSFICGSPDISDERNMPISFGGIGQGGERSFLLPLCTTISRNSHRMKVQSGNFVAFNLYASLNMSEESTEKQFDYLDLMRIQKYYFDNFNSICPTKKKTPFIYKLTIQQKFLQELPGQLQSTGINRSRLYPELPEIGEIIKKKIFDKKD